ncbi:class F sortase [Nocardioides jishulii]|uniref:Class F sortase n=1 Tax=Nocardioides jishulii TaxID=2575440 RepID=A0A4U2YRU3_9ACTN|nr:class F sortase [Nocardioides jishulii]QCX27894.1 class F sortase [Nocardioides jishulii]TKI62701.1 class F sortase [Nocardioides jishulii]
MPGPAGSHTGAARTPLRRWVLPTCLFVVTLALATAGILITQGDSTATPGKGPGQATVAPTSSPTQAADEVDLSRSPVSISIAAIDVASDLVRLGLQSDRTVQVPEDADKAGWYELGAAPGQVGSAVILGHVDSSDGPAVFHRLGELAPGARIRVRMGTGDDEVFAVSRVETVRNADFPAAEVYASHGRPTLTLVTCGGEYDRARGGYQSNVIVYSERVEAHR